MFSEGAALLLGLPSSERGHDIAKGGPVRRVPPPALVHQALNCLLDAAVLWELGDVALCYVLRDVLCFNQREWNAAREELKEQIAKRIDIRLGMVVS